MSLQPLTKGPRKVRDKLNAPIEALNKGIIIEGPGITAEKQPDGRVMVSIAKPSGTETPGGGGGGDNNYETVTGAVNGVPSTLVVQTDGGGWTAVP